MRFRDARVCLWFVCVRRSFALLTGESSVLCLLFADLYRGGARAADRHGEALALARAGRAAAEVAEQPGGAYRWRHHLLRRVSGRVGGDAVLAPVRCTCQMRTIFVCITYTRPRRSSGGPGQLKSLRPQSGAQPLPFLTFSSCFPRALGGKRQPKMLHLRHFISE